MITRVRHISAFFEKWAPKATKLDYDNVGLLVGDSDQEVKKIITCLDCTASVVEEAVKEKADLIVAHHPLIFKKLSSVTSADEQGRIIRQLIKHDISLLAVHTNLDAASDGVSVLLAEILGLKNISILQQSPHMQMLTANSTLKEDDFLSVPFVKVIEANGQNISILLPGYKRKDVTNYIAGRDANSHNFTWLDISSTEEYQGFGAIGELKSALSDKEFLKIVTNKLGCEAIRFSGQAKEIKRVAVCGGSGAQLTSAAIAAGADAYVTADIKYHEYFTDTNDFLLVDTGHYENEIPIVAEMRRRLDSEFKDVAVTETSVNTNPMKIFKK